MMAHLHAVTDNRGALRYNEFHLSAVLASPDASLYVARSTDRRPVRSAPGVCVRVMQIHSTA